MKRTTKKSTAADKARTAKEEPTPRRQREIAEAGRDAAAERTSLQVRGEEHMGIHLSHPLDPKTMTVGELVTIALAGEVAPSEFLRAAFWDHIDELRLLGHWLWDEAGGEVSADEVASHVHRLMLRARAALELSDRLNDANRDGDAHLIDGYLWDLGAELKKRPDGAARAKRLFEMERALSAPASAEVQ